ncbi:MAG: hypothetical protein JST53_11775 [Actinobacteria bacterium]|nr:hypothetical protein [Actinomycetota bacterium]
MSLAVAAVGILSAASMASAHTGEFAKFNYCPSTTTGVFKCLYSVTNGGKVVLGKKTVPIVNPVTIQGGISAENEASFSSFYAATNGVTLSKTPQPVPGGLAGLVNCKEISVSWLRVSCEAVFENGITGVNATLELARPASEIVVSQTNLVGEEGLAFQLPVRVHLENPFLGSACYIGSSSSPIIWHLTTGTTSPPAGTAPIHGEAGEGAFKEEGRIFELTHTELVDNAWSAPGSTGCGGFLAELLLDPIINASVGVPSAAGKNVAQLSNVTTAIATATAVNNH